VRVLSALGAVVSLLSLQPSAGLAPDAPIGGATAPTEDRLLFSGNLAPERAGWECLHIPGSGHGHRLTGLSPAVLFAEPHDCGGFHGNLEMAAAVLDLTVPVELLSWGSRFD
jgi:hypothetical protein